MSSTIKIETQASSSKQSHENFSSQEIPFVNSTMFTEEVVTDSNSSWYFPQPQGIDLSFNQIKEKLGEAMESICKLHKEALDLHAVKDANQTAMMFDCENMKKKLHEAENENSRLSRTIDKLVEENNIMQVENSVIKREIADIKRQLSLILK